MNEIEKCIRKMSPKDKKRILEVYYRLKNRDVSIKSKKLKANNKFFRVRVGDYRIIYFDDGKNVILKNIRRRDESTYSDL